MLGWDNISAIGIDDARAAAYPRRTLAGALPISWRLVGAKRLHMLIRSVRTGDDKPPENWDRVQYLFPEAEIKMVRVR